MNILIQCVNFDKSSNLVNTAIKKIKKISCFYNNIILCKIYLKIDQCLKKRNTIGIMAVIPHNTLFVKKYCKNFYEGINIAVDSLIVQLKKYK